jgi:single-stranded DNA-binding protein
MDEYTDREGQRRTWTQVVADNVQSLQTRAESEGGGDDRAERRGGRWEHDRDFEEGDEAPKGRDDRERAPRENGRREEREPAGRGGRREEFRPREEAPRGASAAGGSYDNDDDDPFAGE